MEHSFNADDPVQTRYQIEDPLGLDRDDDQVVITTRRALCRVAFVAAETAYRFERGGIGYDAMAWLMVPRRLFDGMSALDACLDRTNFQRAIILHGLCLGLDASPDDIDGLTGDDDLDDDSVPPLDQLLPVCGMKAREGSASSNPSPSSPLKSSRGSRSRRVRPSRANISRLGRIKKRSGSFRGGLAS